MICVSAFTLSSCNDKIEIQQHYDYALSTMPVPSEVELGEEVEIRCELIKSGNYAEGQHTIRYFQTEGDGELRIEYGAPLRPNDRYILTKDKFYLYYTSRSAEQQSIDIYIEDGWQVQKYTFEFSNKQVEEEEDAGVEQNL